jgi:hypothetical protein
MRGGNTSNGPGGIREPFAAVGFNSSRSNVVMPLPTEVGFTSHESRVICEGSRSWPRGVAQAITPRGRQGHSQQLRVKIRIPREPSVLTRVSDITAKGGSREERRAHTACSMCSMLDIGSLTRSLGSDIAPWCAWMNALDDFFLDERA